MPARILQSVGKMMIRGHVEVDALIIRDSQQFNKSYEATIRSRARNLRILHLAFTAGDTGDSLANLKNSRLWKAICRCVKLEELYLPNMVLPSSLILKFLKNQIIFDIKLKQFEKRPKREPSPSPSPTLEDESKCPVESAASIREGHMKLRKVRLVASEKRRTQMERALAKEDRWKETVEKLLVKGVFYDNPSKIDFMSAIQKLIGSKCNVEDRGIHGVLLTRQKQATTP